MMAILPHSRRSLVFLAVLVTAAGIRLAGESGIRLGSTQPAGLEFRWIVLLGLAAFFLVPASPQRPSIGRHLFAAIALLFLAAPLTVWHQSIFDTPPNLVAQVSRPSDPARSVGETLSIDSLRLGHRRYLHQIVGRRRDIALDIQGYVLVQRTGQHRFFLSCDDACTLNVDGWTFTQSSRTKTDTTFLESGLHPFKLHYVQKGGPARLEVAWDRPAWIELLGLDHYVSSRPEDLHISAVNRREWQAGLCLASWLFWWTLVSQLGSPHRGVATFLEGDIDLATSCVLGAKSRCHRSHCFWTSSSLGRTSSPLQSRRGKSIPGKHPSMDSARTSQLQFVQPAKCSRRPLPGRRPQLPGSGSINELLRILRRLVPRAFLRLPGQFVPLALWRTRESGSSSKVSFFRLPFFRFSIFSRPD